MAGKMAVLPKIIMIMMMMMMLFHRRTLTICDANIISTLQVRRPFILILLIAVNLDAGL
jgi:hypothetical protein